MSDTTTAGPTQAAPAEWPEFPGEYERTHQALVEQAHAGPSHVVFLGDSITQGWDPAVWAERGEPLGAVNMGIGGDQTQNVLWRIDHGALDGINPRLVVLMIGVNNLWTLEWTADEIAAGIARIVERIQGKRPGAKILVLGILPTQAMPDNPLRTLMEAINRRGAALDNGATVHFRDIGAALLEPDGTLTTDIEPDGCHLSPEGYRRVADAIAPTVRALLAE